MGLIESDPRDVNHIALYTAVKWYEEISSEVAIRIARGSSHRKPGRHLTPEMLAEIKRLMESPNFTTIKTVVRKYRINKYEIYEALSDKNRDDEGVIRNMHIDTLIGRVKVVMAESSERAINQAAIPILKKIKKQAEECEAVDCEKCTLNKIMCGKYTLCEKLGDAEPTYDEAVQLLKCLGIGDVIQKYNNCITTDNLTGKVVLTAYRIDKKAVDEIKKYAEKHSHEKIQDIVSLALLEYVEKRK